MVYLTAQVRNLGLKSTRLVVVPALSSLSPNSTLDLPTLNGGLGLLVFGLGLAGIFATVIPIPTIVGRIES